MNPRLILAAILLFLIIPIGITEIMVNAIVQGGAWFVNLILYLIELSVNIPIALINALIEQFRNVEIFGVKPFRDVIKPIAYLKLPRLQVKWIDLGPDNYSPLATFFRALFPLDPMTATVVSIAIFAIAGVLIVLR